MISESALVKLRAKLVDSCVHLKKLEDDKKEMARGYGEQIKAAKKRIEAFSAAIKTGHVEELAMVVDEYEMKVLVGE